MFYFEGNFILIISYRFILGCWINIVSSTDQSILGEYNSFVSLGIIIRINDFTALPFNVTYLLVNDNRLASNDLNSIDRVALARSDV
jgi:hypothetical protein